MTIPKKHLLNISLALVFLISFIYFTSEEEKEVAESPKTTDKISEVTIQQANTETIPQNSASVTNQVPAEINKSVATENNIPITDPGAPYKALEKVANGNNSNQALTDSFKQLQGGSVSTETIIERNTYFKKLSDQMKELQGSVNTDSTAPPAAVNPSNNNSPSEAEINDELDQMEDPLDEDQVIDEDSEIIDDVPPE